MGPKYRQSNLSDGKPAKKRKRRNAQKEKKENYLGEEDGGGKEGSKNLCLRDGEEVAIKTSEDASVGPHF